MHRPIRPWWAPWRRRCRCGVRRWPCIDREPPAGPAVADYLRGDRPDWTGPTLRLRTVPPVPDERPLMTPGQQWRADAGRRRG
jgi:hypothetical protein